MEEAAVREAYDLGAGFRDDDVMTEIRAVTL